MSEVIKHDFGKDDREHARRFARLLKLSEDHEAAILADPVKYIEIAGEAIAEQEQFVRLLKEALRTPWLTTLQKSPADEPLTMNRIETINIDRREYDALQSIKLLLNSRK